MIDGVVFKELRTFTDDRGYFRETLRVTDEFFREGFGQCSHSMMFNGVAKAWHLHRKQIDWWYVVSGVLRVGLCDLREGSATFRKSMDFLMGEHQPAQVLKIPPGIAHGCKVIQGPAHLVYVTSRVYDPQDELRLPHDDPGIGFDWLKGPDIK